MPILSGKVVGNRLVQSSQWSCINLGRQENFVIQSQEKEYIKRGTAAFPNAAVLTVRINEENHQNIFFISPPPRALNDGSNRNAWSFCLSLSGCCPLPTNEP